MKSFMIVLFAFLAFVKSEEFSCRDARCERVEPNSCLQRGLAFVPAEGRDCCHRCADPNVVTNKGKCMNKCKNVRCMPQTIDDCRQGEVLIPADNDCFCCPTCLPRRENRKADWCPNIEPEYCLSRGLAFVPRGKCNECDECRKVNEVSRVDYCIPEMCMNPQLKCRDDSIRECKVDQVLLPRGPCQCCVGCADNIVRC